MEKNEDLTLEDLTACKTSEYKQKLATEKAHNYEVKALWLVNKVDANGVVETVWRLTLGDEVISDRVTSTVDLRYVIDIYNKM